MQFTGEQNGSIICGLLGTTTLFDAATLASLYPSHRAYVARFDTATRNAVRAGILLKADAKLLKRWARGSNVGRRGGRPSAGALTLGRRGLGASEQRRARSARAADGPPESFDRARRPCPLDLRRD